MLRRTLFVFALVGWLLSACFPWAILQVIDCPMIPWGESGPSSWEAAIGVGAGPLELWTPGNRFWVELPLLWVVLMGVSATALAGWGSRTANPIALGSASLLQLAPSLALALFHLDGLNGGDPRLGVWLGTGAIACTWGLLGLELKAPPENPKVTVERGLNDPATPE